MNRTANALGMTRTTFKNAHGLTESGHLSTARDMTTMGRRLFYDYPQYYNIFSRQTHRCGHPRRGQYQPPPAGKLQGRRRDQDRLYERGRIQPRRLGRTRQRTGHRNCLRRPLDRHPQRARRRTSRPWVQARALPRRRPQAAHATLSLNIGCREIRPYRSRHRPKPATTGTARPRRASGRLDRRGSGDGFGDVWPSSNSTQNRPNRL